MQSHHEAWIHQAALDKSLTDVDFQAKADSIKKETTNLPKGMITPTAEEIKEMVRYVEQYRMKHPKASKRNCKRAVQRKFNIHMLPDTI